MDNEFFVEPVILERETEGELEFRAFERAYDLNNYFHTAIKVKGSPKLSIAVLAFNNLQSVQMCIEFVLGFAEGLDYELVLMDNASDDNDAIYNYFQTVPFRRKKIIQARGDLGRYFSAARGWSTLWSYCEGDYILHLNDDHYITPNAVQNMIRALDSDASIGMVNPMAKGAWMGQDPGLRWNSWEEMFEVTEQFNQYDPSRWQERIYVAATAWMFRRELLGCFVCPNPFGPELYYDFSIRREGYRVMLLGDTFVCHNHMSERAYGFIGDSDEKKQQQQAIGEMCKHYYYGMDLYDDICAFEHKLVSMIDNPMLGSAGAAGAAGVSDGPEGGQTAAVPSILAVDVKAGQGLLDVKNRLRSFGIYDSKSVAFSTDVKYYPMLHTIADEAYVDRIRFMNQCLAGDTFDYIIAGTPVNMYGEPLKLLSELLSKLNDGGTLLFKLRNVATIMTVHKILMQANAVDIDMPCAVTENDVIALLRESGCSDADIRVGMERYYTREDFVELADNFLKLNPAADCEDAKRRLLARDFLFAVKKPR